MAGSTTLPKNSLKKIIRVWARLWNCKDPMIPIGVWALMSKLRGQLLKDLSQKSAHHHQRDSIAVLHQSCIWSTFGWKRFLSRLNCRLWIRMSNQFSSIRNRFWGSRNWGQSGRNNWPEWVSAWISRTINCLLSPTDISNRFTKLESQCAELIASLASNQN